MRAPTLMMMTATMVLGGIGLSDAPAGLIGSASDAAVSGTWSFDFEADVMVAGTPESDMFWHMYTANTRAMEIYFNNPEGGLYAFGSTVAFEDLSEADLMALEYSRDGIPGGDGVKGGAGGFAAWT